MIYKVCLSPLPVLREYYEISRNTVWKCADERNILVCVTDGECFFNIEGEEIHAKTGDALLIPARHAYVRSPVDGKMCQLFYFHFDTAVLITETDEIAAASDEQNDFSVFVHVPRKVIPIRYASKVNEFLSRIRSDKAELMLHSRALSSACLCELIALLSDENRQSETPADTAGKYPPPLKTALAYIRSHISEHIEIGILSRACGVSPQHLGRLFNRFFSMSPVAYINRAKIMHSIDMLRISELSIQEISYALGFDNPNYFTRLFTSVTGVSPTERRRQIRNYR